MVRECGLVLCTGHGAGIGQLVVGIKIEGEIIGSTSPVHKFVQSNSLVIGLRSCHNKSGTFEVNVHNPFAHDLCLQ